MYLKKKNYFPTKLLQEIAVFLSFTLVTLGEEKILHRDINPTHILVNIDEYGEVRYKLCGLICCKNIAEGEAKSLVGTQEYAAPETSMNIPYDNKVDVWSVGLTLYELAVGVRAGVVDPDYRVKLKKGLPITFPEEPTVYPGLKDFIGKCLMFDPEKRMNPNEMVSHPFIFETIELSNGEVKKEKKTNKELIEMIHKNLGSYIEYVNKINVYKRKFKVDVRSSLEPYTLDDDNPMNKGGFSSIYLCTSRKNNVKYVLKVVKNSAMRDVKVTDLLLGEIQIMLELNYGLEKLCPFAIKIEDYFIYKNDLCLVLEYCNGGDLERYIRKAKRAHITLSLEKMKLIAWNAACGLNEMHKRKMMHRDIKPMNILVVTDLKTQELIDVKLCDYGLGKKMEESGEIIGTTILGTECYFAPEIAEMKEKHQQGLETTMHYNEKVDVWSYGALLYFVLYGKNIMEPPNSRWNVLNHEIIEYPEIASVYDSYISLIKKALINDPNKRPSFSELLNDPFFCEVKFRIVTTLEPYIKGDLIGIGADDFTKVYKCKKAGYLYAMKEMTRGKIEEKRLLAEIDTLVKLKNNSNIIRIHDYFATDKFVYLIMDYYSGANLSKYVRNREMHKNPLSVEEATFIAYCILNGIKDIHTHNIIHRSIKPNNVLLTFGTNNEVKNATISEFGVARVLLSLNAETNIIDASYTAPEMIIEEFFKMRNTKIDIWTYGMTVYYLIFGQNPADNLDNANVENVLSTGNVKYDKNRAEIYPQLLDLMHHCLKPNPDERPTAPELLMLPIFKKYVEENANSIPNK